MKFNKIKTLTTDKEKFIEAIKDSNVIELSPKLDGIRKKIIS